MVKQIITVDSDELQVLAARCIDADYNDVPALARDLRDTAESVKDRCAGLAANQIGYSLRAFALKRNGDFTVLINPTVVGRSTSVKASYESCLSRPGYAPIRVRRAKEITLSYFCPELNVMKQETFKKFEAVVVQHELDHLRGEAI